MGTRAIESKVNEKSKGTANVRAIRRADTAIANYKTKKDKELTTKKARSRAANSEAYEKALKDMLKK